MIDKRLLNMVGGDIKYIYLNVLFQWLSLAGNIVMMYFISDMLMKLFQRNARAMDIWIALIVSVVVLIVRYICSKASTRMSFLSSKAVKKTFRTKIYEKLLRLGSSYQEQVKSSEVVQVTVEGVDQLETYFGAYIPQFFYAMIAPLTLMLVIGFTVTWFSAGMVKIPALFSAVMNEPLAKYWISQHCRSFCRFDKSSRCPVPSFTTRVAGWENSRLSSLMLSPFSEDSR